MAVVVGFTLTLLRIFNNIVVPSKTWGISFAVNYDILISELIRAFQTVLRSIWCP